MKSRKIPKKIERRKKTVWIMILCAVVLFWTILPPSLGKIPLFYDDNGTVIPDSISEKIFIDVDGTEIGLLITGKNKSNPVLLFLGGGPGIPEYLLEYQKPSKLADEFVVCYLEYRGTSISYNSNIDAASLTTERYLSDTAAVTEYLKNRFSQEKIYLMGHSFGTFIGIQAALKHPESYHAYLAMSQIADQSESEIIAYQFMLNQYRQMNNQKMIREFEKYPIASSDRAYSDYCLSPLRDRSMHDLGVGTTHTMDSVITGIFLPSLRCKVYTPLERINIWRGKQFTASSPVGTDRMQFNTFAEVPCLKIPVYFFSGIYDYTCCYSLQKKYFDAVNAPLKGFYTFHNSAHSPLWEESDRFIEILIQDVLNGTNEQSD
ncbi:alpha/beta hydrolase [Hungatella sp. L12]|uniref:Alpha/beta hydrolase n=2 Tax=Hungatella hominis TaxID=2763050 RepID=A0ABR7H6S3_9FIRM|nr:alpha/beta hydrolase [Hungatella hominis]